MGCYIKKYEELRKALKFSDQFVIVKKGFSVFYTQPESCHGDDELLDSLGLEVALGIHVDEFNKVYEFCETPWSMEVINQMNLPTWERSPIEPPKTYNLLQKALYPYNPIYPTPNFCIISQADAVDNGLKISRYNDSVLIELGLTIVYINDFSAHFPLIPVTNEYFELNQTSDHKHRLYYPVKLTMNLDQIKKALADMAEAAKKVSEKIAMDAKAYGYCVTDLGNIAYSYLGESLYTCSGTLSMPSYGTVSSTVKEVDRLTVRRSKTNYKLKGTWALRASDLDDVVNSAFKKTKLYKRLEDIRFRYIGKPDTESNRMAMDSEIKEIFDEIGHTTGDVNLIDGEIKACGGSIKYTTDNTNSIAGEWCECESCPPVIVNIGAININSKEELDTEWSESVRKKFAKQFRESCEKVFREHGIL